MELNHRNMRFTCYTCFNFHINSFLLSGFALSTNKKIGEKLGSYGTEYKENVFWDVASCRLVEINRLAAVIIRASPDDGARSTSGSSVKYRNTRRNNPEDSRENFKSH
jgi:hypothetical protein